MEEGENGKKSKPFHLLVVFHFDLISYHSSSECFSLHNNKTNTLFLFLSSSFPMLQQSASFIGTTTDPIEFPRKNWREKTVQLGSFVWFRWVRTERTMITTTCSRWCWSETQALGNRTSCLVSRRTNSAWNPNPPLASNSPPAASTSMTRSSRLKFGTRQAKKGPYFLLSLSLSSFHLGVAKRFEFSMMSMFSICRTSWIKSFRLKSLFWFLILVLFRVSFMDLNRRKEHWEWKEGKKIVMKIIFLLVRRRKSERKIVRNWILVTFFVLQFIF